MIILRNEIERQLRERLGPDIEIAYSGDFTWSAKYKPQHTEFDCVFSLAP